MGFHQELVLACDLKEDCPQEIIDILNYIFHPEHLVIDKKDDTNAPKIPQHDFFQFNDNEWKWFYNDSYAFSGEAFARLTYDNYGYYKLTLRTMLKYGSDIVAAFLNWIAPHSRSEGFVGYTRSDEDPEVNLIYFEDGAAWYKETQFWNTPPTIKSRKL